MTLLEPRGTADRRVGDTSRFTELLADGTLERWVTVLIRRHAAADRRHDISERVVSVVRHHRPLTTDEDVRIAFAHAAAAVADLLGEQMISVAAVVAVPLRTERLARAS